MSSLFSWGLTSYLPNPLKAKAIKKQIKLLQNVLKDNGINYTGINDIAVQKIQQTLTATNDSKSDTKSDPNNNDCVEKCSTEKKDTESDVNENDTLEQYENIKFRCTLKKTLDHLLLCNDHLLLCNEHILQEMREIKSNQTNQQSNIQTNKYDKFQLWLINEVELEQYCNILVENGFDSLDAISTINMDELLQIGIQKMGHRKQLMKHIQLLDCNNMIQNNVWFIECATNFLAFVLSG
eukprot:487852_1